MRSRRPPGCAPVSPAEPGAGVADRGAATVSGVIEQPPQAELRTVGFANLPDARAAWTELAERTANVFSTWDWADVWWRHFGAGKTPRLVGLARDHDVVAIVPLHEQRRRGLRVLRLIGHGVADQLGPVCGPFEIGAATEALEPLLARGGILLAERLPTDRDWAAALRGTMLSEEASPLVDIAAEGDFESYLSTRSSNFRQQVRRRARKLSRSEGVSFRLTEDPARLQRDLAMLFSLHAARWGSESSAFTGAREAFHREFAARALERGWLRLWTADGGGAPVAALYGFRFAGVECFYQSGRDPNWNRTGVGAGLLEHAIREAFADGMHEYRLLRGDEDYKRRYASRDTSICTVAAARTPVGRGAVALVNRLLEARGGRRLLGRPGD
jgi:CelD/BcsL family acetyltransferase involved in cellulose biosynthesis